MEYKEKKSGLIKFLLAIYIPLAIISLALVGWLMYYHMFLKSNFSLTTNFVDNASFSEKDKFQIEMNVFSNEKGNGEKVVEIKFNYYVDVGMPEKDDNGIYEDKLICSSGVQIVGDEGFDFDSALGWWRDTDKYLINKKSASFYETAGELESSTAIVSVPEMDKFIWDIGGQLCKISFKEETLNENGFLGWGIYFDYDIQSLCYELYNQALSMSDGDHIYMANLSQYYHVTLYNEESGAFEEEYNLNEEWTFANIKLTKTNNGMVEANQSMFKKFQYNADWSYYGEGGGTDLYWEANTVVELGADDFTFVANGNEYELTLKSSCIDFYSEFSNVVFEVVIDCDNFDQYLNPVGFAEDAFGSFEIEKVELMSSEQRTFRVPQGDFELVTTNVEVLYA